MIRTRLSVKRSSLTNILLTLFVFRHFSDSVLFFQMPNINKLAAGDAVYVGEKLLTVTLVDPIHLFVNAKDDTGSIIEFRPWQLHVPAKKEEEGTARRKGCPKQEEDAAAVEESAPKRMKNSEDSGDTGDSFFFKSVLHSDGVFVRLGGTYFVCHLLNGILVVTNITGYKDGRFIVDFLYLHQKRVY